jgi:Flp pilus assembly protein TadG
MMGCNLKKIYKTFGIRGQAIVEFAIVLPVLLMMLIGILEIGRMIFIYAAATNASRNAVRYASAVGLEDTGTYHKYLYCDGIRETAMNSAFLMNLDPANDIDISYDSGPATSSLGNCDVSGDEASISVPDGGRVNVTVHVTFRPMVNLVPIPERNWDFTSSRTILGIINVDE